MLLRSLLNGLTLIGLTVQAKELASTDTLEPLELVRTVDLLGSSSKASSVITLDLPSSSSSSSSSKEGVVLLSYPAVCNNTPRFAPPQLVTIEARLGRGASAAGKNADSPLLIEPLAPVDPCIRSYNVHVPLDSLSQDQNVSITLRETFDKPGTPLPKSVPQLTYDQYLVYHEDILGPLIGQSVPHARCRVRTPTQQVEIMDQTDSEYLNPQHTAGSNVVVFSTNSTIEAGQGHSIAIRYHSPEPLRTFASAHRRASISHWGNSVHLNDRLDLRNSGPKLEGQFSRIEHQIAILPKDGTARTPSQPPPHVIGTVGFRIPPEADAIEYYDGAGKVSNLRLRRSGKASTNVDLGPRYPIPGGGKYVFSLSHRLPLSSLARRIVDAFATSTITTAPRYAADIPTTIVSTLVGDRAAIDTLSLRIDLPRGATDPQVAVQGNGTHGFMCAIQPGVLKEQDMLISSLDDSSTEDQERKAAAQVENSQIDSSSSCTISYVNTRGILDIFGRRLSVVVTGNDALSTQSVLVTYSLPISSWLLQPAQVGSVLAGLYLTAIIARRIFSTPTPKPLSVTSEKTVDDESSS